MDAQALKTRCRLIAAAVAGAAFAADQISKFWVIEIIGIEDRPPIRLTPFLDVVMAWNPGISYSLLPADTALGLVGLLALAALAFGVLGAWLWTTADRPTALALGLVMGGALGNALDRARYGAVADFLHLHTTLPVGPLANYVFNIADAAIVAGVLVLLYESFRPRPAGPQV
ncbi:MAG: signal peptidase II [Rhodoblastus sp.]